MATEIVPATHEHADVLAPSLRAEDVAELASCGYSGGHAALHLALRSSEVAFTVMRRAGPIAMFGIRRIQHPTVRAGEVWFLTSQAFGASPFVARLGRPAVRMLLQHCELLLQFIDARYEAALRWANWVGFELLPAVPYGVNGEPFHPARIWRDRWAP